MYRALVSHCHCADALSVQHQVYSRHPSCTPPVRCWQNWHTHYAPQVTAGRYSGPSDPSSRNEQSDPSMLAAPSIWDTFHRTPSSRAVIRPVSAQLSREPTARSMPSSRPSSFRQQTARSCIAQQRRTRPSSVRSSFRGGTQPSRCRCVTGCCCRGQCAATPHLAECWPKRWSETLRNQPTKGRIFTDHITGSYSTAALHAVK